MCRLIKLYSNVGCPKCDFLKSEMDSLGIDYEYTTDIKEARKLGFLTVPLLEVDNKVMTFPDAVKWLKNGGKEN